MHRSNLTVPSFAQVQPADSVVMPHAGAFARARGIGSIKALSSQWPYVAAIHKDTLYCLAMMQHHGAPTRLMDWTYSPFVAAKFAAGEGTGDAAIWCLNAKWCQETAEAEPVVGNNLI
jgi:hypothetical protein